MDMKKNMGTMRRSSKGRRSTRRGGAASLPNLPASPPNSGKVNAKAAKDACAALLRKLLPHEGDFERMKAYDYANVQGKTYKQFIQASVSKVYAMSEADCAFHKALFERILKQNVKTMDMEYASTMGAYNVFFDTKGNIVIVTPR
jgi:hypothetical protein